MSGRSLLMLMWSADVAKAAWKEPPGPTPVMLWKVVQERQVDEEIIVHRRRRMEIEPSIQWR